MLAQLHSAQETALCSSGDQRETIMEHNTTEATTTSDDNDNNNNANTEAIITCYSTRNRQSDGICGAFFTVLLQIFDICRVDKKIDSLLFNLEFISIQVISSFGSKNTCGHVFLICWQHYKWTQIP